MATSSSALKKAFVLLLACLRLAGALRDLRLAVLIVQDASSGVEEELFCVRYFPTLHNFTSSRDDVEFSPLGSIVYLGEDVPTCDGVGDRHDVAGKFAYVHARNSVVRNCSLARRAAVVAENGAIGMLANSSLASFRTGQGNSAHPGIPVAALVGSRDMARLLDLKAQHPDWEFGIYAPVESSFDFSLLVLLVMAVVTIGVGSLWSGYVRHGLRLRKNAEGSAVGGGEQRREDEEQICEHAEGGGHGQPHEEISMRISPAYVLLFVVLMCSLLVLLYFYFSYLVYIIIGMFCLASTIAVYSCFEPLVMWTYELFPSCPTLRLPKCNFYLLVLNIELRQFLLLSASVAISIVWLVFRNQSWAWALQDSLGILFSINMLKVLRLPSLKICTVLLSTLFVYDIFFVFVTPLITRNGKSIMAEVATGGETGEQLPMVLKVPHLNCGAVMGTCGAYSMLGFGDILVPGLLLSYCHSYDLHAATPCRLYWLITNISYFLGLLATFASLYLMESAQPALLYLVPFTLLPVIIIALIRGDFVPMWRGDFGGEAEHTSFPDTSEPDPEPPEEIENEPRAVERRD